MEKTREKLAWLSANGWECAVRDDVVVVRETISPYPIVEIAIIDGDFNTAITEAVRAALVMIYAMAGSKN